MTVLLPHARCLGIDPDPAAGFGEDSSHDSGT
jgi:hypothetical protein